MAAWRSALWSVTFDNTAYELAVAEAELGERIARP